MINLNQQIRNFEEVTLPELEAELGRCTTSQSLEDYLFVVGTGGNDYSFNYFLTTSSRNVTLETFTANLTASLSTQLKVHAFNYYIYIHVILILFYRYAIKSDIKKMFGKLTKI